MLAASAGVAVGAKLQERKQRNSTLAFQKKLLSEVTLEHGHIVAMEVHNEWLKNGTPLDFPYMNVADLVVNGFIYKYLFSRALKIVIFALGNATRLVEFFTSSQRKGS